MDTFKAGDLITFRLHGESYGLARLVYVEELSLHVLYHLEILDAILTAEDEGADSYGVPYERSHVLDGAEDSPVVIDHVALTREAFAESSPVKVGERVLGDDDPALDGYHIWLHVKRNEMIRRGELREHTEEPEDEIEEVLDEVYEGEDLEEDLEEGVEESDEVSGAEDADPAEDDLLRAVTARAWHAGEYHRPLGELLFEPNFREELSSPELRETKLSGFVNGFFEGNNSDQIDEMVTRFAEGDYGAGHELMAFGAPAADALGELLRGNPDPQLADDALNILCDMGHMRAYEHVALFFTDHEPNEDDPLSLSAARGLCYAVMLTGGTPGPLHQQLDRLDDIAATFPELAHDVESAREAATNVTPQEIDGPKGTTSSPFGSL
jgi:hypothetical protein